MDAVDGLIFVFPFLMARFSAKGALDVPKVVVLAFIKSLLARL